MNGRTNALTGSGSGKGAIIRVIAPDGAGVSFSFGGVVAKSFSASEGVLLSSDGTRRIFYYAIPERLYGTWTVVSRNSNGSYTMTVSVTEAKQYDLDATEIWFVKDGKFAKGATHFVSSSGGSCWLAEQGSYVQLNQNTGAADRWGAGYIRDTIAFDGYWRKLTVTTQEKGKYVAGGAPICGFTNGSGYAPGLASYIQLRSDDGGGINRGGIFNGWHTSSLNVSGLNGDYRFAMRVRSMYVNSDYYWDGSIRMTNGYLTAI